MRKRALGGYLVVAAVGCSVQPAWSAPGALDPTFTLRLDGSPLQSVAVQTDGKLVVAGESLYFGPDFFLRRYQSDSRLDAAFGDGGILPVNGLLNIAVQPDGKVVASGGRRTEGRDSFALTRYEEDGRQDTTFGGGVVVMTDMGGQAISYALAIQEDGKLLLVGSAGSDDGDRAFAAARYNGDGSLDATFGRNGIVVTSIGSDAVARGVAVQSDGGILVVGNAKFGTEYSVALVRYTSNGSLDATFGKDGIASLPSEFPVMLASAAALQSDGKIVVAGRSEGDVALVRYRGDGSLDDTFGNDGIVMSQPGAQGSGVSEVAVQPDGKIVVAGYVEAGYRYWEDDGDLLVARYSANGELDASFGRKGFAIAIGYFGLEDYVRSFALQPDGKLMVVGKTWDGIGNHGILARFILSDTPWDLTPAAITFAQQRNIPLDSTRTSGQVTVTGLDPGMKVPLQVRGGSYSLNGGAYTTHMGWVENGDTLTVRHSASRSPSTAVTTTLTLGGLISSNNPGLILGKSVSATFTSTTAPANDSGGGGVWDLPLLAALTGLGLRSRRQGRRA